MPAKKKPAKRRALLLRLDAELFDALAAFSEATGVPRTEFICDVLQSALPAIRDLTAAALKAKQGVAEPDLLRSIRQAIVNAQDQGDQLVLAIDDKLKPKAVKRARAA